MGLKNVDCFRGGEFGPTTTIRSNWPLYQGTVAVTKLAAVAEVSQIVGGISARGKTEGTLQLLEAFEVGLKRTECTFFGDFVVIGLG